MKKILFSMLALLFAMGGAWAQGPTQVTQFTTDMIADWQGVNENLTLADLQDLGFVAVDESVAQAWTGAPQDGHAFLFYDVDGGIGTVKFILFNNGNVQTSTQSSYTKSWFYNEVANGTNKFFYTGSPAIELTKSGANQWTLGQTPDYDLELQVEYYQPHALKDIPEGWTVLVNGVPQTQPYDGDSLMITETDTVTLIPAGNPRRVKSVTLEEDVPTVTIDGVTLDVTGCTLWAEIIARNPDKLEDYYGYVLKKDNDYILTDGGEMVTSSVTFNPSANYKWKDM